MKYKKTFIHLFIVLSVSLCLSACTSITHSPSMTFDFGWSWQKREGWENLKEENHVVSYKADNRLFSGIIIGYDGERFLCKNGVIQKKLIDYRSYNDMRYEITYANGKPSKERVYDQSKKLISESHYLDGKEHGTQTTWFNGLYHYGKYKEENYKEGKLDGISTEWTVNGRLYSQTMYKEGLKHGKHIMWQTNNSIPIILGFKKKESEETYIKGKREGFAYGYHTTNSFRDIISSIYYYKDDKPNGIAKTFYVNGCIKSELGFKNNRLHGICNIWQEDGTPIRSGYFSDGKKHGSFTEYFSDGTIESEQLYQNDLIYDKVTKQPFTGIIVDYSPDKVKLSETSYKDARKHGLEITYSKGIKSRAKEYVEGKASGKSISYHPNGQIATECTYVNDKIDGNFISFHSNGKIKSEGTYIHGAKNGSFKSYYFNGMHKEHTEFKNGKMHGISQTWLSTGQLETNNLYENGNLVRILFTEEEFKKHYPPLKRTTKRSKKYLLEERNKDLYAEFHSLLKDIREQARNPRMTLSENYMAKVLRIKEILEKGVDPNVVLKEYNIKPIVCAAGNIKLFEKLIENGAEIDPEAFVSVFFFHNLNIPIYFRLKEYGADINYVDKNSYEWKPIITSIIRNGRFPEAAFLTENGANINSWNHKGESVLMTMIGRGKLDNAQKTVELGADVNHTGKLGFTPLMKVFSLNFYTFEKKQKNGLFSRLRGRPQLDALSYDNWLKFAEQLISKGADINALNNEGLSAFYYADLKGKKFLLKHSAKVNNYNSKTTDTALIKAVSDNDQEMIKFLLENGADANRINKREESALTAAFRRMRGENLRELIELLLKHGADVNHQNKYKKAAIHILCDSYKKTGDSEELLKLLIKNGADINLKDRYGDTPLHHSLERKHFDLVKILLENKADLSIRDNYGNTPFGDFCDSRVNKKTFETAFNLLSNYGKIDIEERDNKGRTPLANAASRSNIELFHHLINNKGANPLTIDNEGKNLLILSTSYDPSSDEMIKAILAAGVDANQKDKSGKSAIDYLKQQKGENAERILDLIKRFYAK